MTTISTAGFGTRSGSIAAFSSPAIEWTIIAFMFVSSMNFSLHYRLFANPARRWGYFRDFEWRWYALAVLTLCVVVSAYLYANLDYSLGQAVTKGTFQVMTMAPTTAYTSVDYT